MEVHVCVGGGGGAFVLAIGVGGVAILDDDEDEDKNDDADHGEDDEDDEDDDDEEEEEDDDDNDDDDRNEWAKRRGVNATPLSRFLRLTMLASAPAGSPASYFFAAATTINAAACVCAYASAMGNWMPWFCPIGRLSTSRHSRCCCRRRRCCCCVRE